MGLFPKVRYKTIFAQFGIQYMVKIYANTVHSTYTHIVANYIYIYIYIYMYMYTHTHTHTHATVIEIAEVGVRLHIFTDRTGTLGL